MNSVNRSSDGATNQLKCTESDLIRMNNPTIILSRIMFLIPLLTFFPSIRHFVGNSSTKLLLLFRNVFGFEKFVPIPALKNFYLQAIFSRRLFLYFTLIAFQCKLAQCQINLGTFNLNKNPQGNLELGFGQGGNLFGFGGDKNLQVTLGPGLFGARTDEGVLLGGERVGVDSHLGLQEGQALNLGSLLKLGNRPVSPFDSVGQLGSLINNLGSMFQPRGPQVPTGPLLPPSRPETRPIRPETSRPEPTLIPLIEQSKRAQISKTTGDGEEFPLSVGSGWDGEGEEGSGNVPEIKGISPPEPRVMPPLKPGITTEGFRRGENGEPDPGQNSGKHDGNTGEASKPKKLPVPDGLEMISGGDNNEDSELLNN
ncbi:hypothetical protein Ddc_02273 [Ditylenchus destructor]|nr:hypothetical protein Ddc_02273 [Ditylenchus destructor]